MNDLKTLLLIPVENQVRELDPKLLLACVAARRGFSSVLGSRREMEFNIDAFPDSIYLSKSMTVRSLLFFRVAKSYNLQIVAWDEEALVHLPPETYFSRRMDPRAVKYVSHLFAWGEDNAQLWRDYPHLPKGLPIHVTGNPRADLLRPELGPFFRESVAELKARHGDFILVNTNFNHVNAFGPDMNLFKPVRRPGQKPKFGRAARGMSRDYAEGLRDHKQAVFEEFQALIPRLAAAFPENDIVVRPHPTESHKVYRKIAAACPRVRVTNEGNVVPWLMAAKALIHNGCTTGVEAFITGTPAVSYRVPVNDRYDNGFYRLPNAMSHQAFDFEQLQEMLGNILDGRLGPAGGEERRRTIDHYLAANSGPLACERMVAELEEIQSAASPSPAPGSALKRWLVTRGLHLAKSVKSHLPGSHNKPKFQKHRFPGISADTLTERIRQLQSVLGDDTGIRVRKLSEVLVKIEVAPHTPGAAATA